MKTIRLISLLFICGLISSYGLMAQEAGKEPVSDSRGYVVSVGEQVPDFMVKYLDGKEALLSSYRGKVVMLQFTASWCSVCRKEMPFIEKDIWQKHKDHPDFLLLGIDLKESAEVTAKFARDINISYPLTLDTDGSRFALFCDPKAGVTRNIIVDKKGKIVMLTRLFDEAEFNEMVKLIDTLLE